jgi:two-component system, LytTR family, response regulator AlgR
MKLRTLIAENEPGVRSFLSGLCSQRPELELVGLVGTGTAALDVIRAVDPQLLLLEADLPDMAGLDVLRIADTTSAGYGVLVTKDPQQHLAEIKKRSVSYLTRPVNPSQFDRMVDAAVARHHREDGAALHFADQGRGPQLIGERAHRFHFLDANAVDYVEVDGNYVMIHIGEDKFLTRMTLKRLTSVLPARDFLRIGRSLIVNLRRVQCVERLESGRFSFTLMHGRQLLSSRERSPAIMRMLRSGVR